MNPNVGTVVTPNDRHSPARACLNRILAVMLSLLLVAVPAATQERARAVLSGLVRDLGGEPVANARVQVADLRRSAVAGQDGRFTLRGLPSGDTLQLIVGRIGYRPVHLVLLLIEGDNDLTVELEPIAQQSQCR